MKLLGLPGRLQSTFVPVAELVRAVRVGATSSHVQTYGFWSDPVPRPLDPAPEAVIAAASRADAVIARSFGTRVTMEAESKHGFKPVWCVFIGVPLDWLRATGAVDLLKAQAGRCPTLFIQQTADPVGSYAEIALLVLPHARATCVEVPGNDHIYNDIPQLAAPIDAWVAGRQGAAGGRM